MLLPLAAGCTIESNSERIYSTEINEKATSPALDKVIEAGRKTPHLALGPSMFGLQGPRMISLDPLGDMREGVMVTQDARTHSGDVPARLKAMPGVEISRKIEIGENEGGEAMTRSVADHPVLLARVRFDCRRNLVTHLSYHTADTFTGPFTHSFTVANPEAKTLAGPMRDAACTKAPAGLETARDSRPLRTSS